MTADTMVGAPPRGGQRLRLLLHSRTGMLGLVLVGFLLVLAIAQAFGLVGTDPLKQAASIRLQGPSAAHWFGTDQFGRDVFSRVAAGVANTTQIAAVAVGVAALVGTLLGVIAGFYLKGPDAIISGVTNVLFAFPPLLLALSLTSDTQSVAQLYNLADSLLAQRLRQLPGVSQVDIAGASTPASCAQADTTRAATRPPTRTTQALERPMSAFPTGHGGRVTISGPTRTGEVGSWLVTARRAARVPAWPSR